MQKTGMPESLKNMQKTMQRIDPMLKVHCDRVAQLATRMASQMGRNSSVQQSLYVAGSLHDYGKIYVPPKILTSRRKLTTQEYDVVKNHAWFSFVQLCDEPGMTSDILDGILHHHERLDGSGYPDGETESSEYARILAIADVFDALTAERPYKMAYQPAMALNIIKQEVEIKYEEDVYDALQNVVCPNRMCITMHPYGCHGC